MFIWILCTILFFISITLIIKFYVIKKSITEIHTQVEMCLREDTNALITVSSNDRQIKILSYALNKELKQLRKQRLKYKNGDHELKEAVTNIAHDIRTPLTALCGYLELLEDKEKTDEVARYLTLISDRADNLKSLTEELFKYSIISSTSENIEVELKNINIVLEESIVEFYTPLNQRGIIPKIYITEKKIYRNINEAALIRVFRNILSNVIKYSDGDLDIILKDTGEIVFINTAKILDEIEVGKLFNRFFTMETAKKGTGLGLSIAKTLVEQMHGTISAQYVEDKLYISVIL